MLLYLTCEDGRHYLRTNNDIVNSVISIDIAKDAEYVHLKK